MDVALTIMVPEGVPEMLQESSTPEAHDRGRFSAKRKGDAVLRLRRGVDLGPAF